MGIMARMDAPVGDRMIGCARCRAAVPIRARFCPRCGAAMGTDQAVAVATPVRRETAAEREARVEAAVDRMLPNRQLGGLWFFVLVIGLVAMAVSGVPRIVGLLLIAGSGVMLVRDVRRHVRIRERAEREVAERLRGG